MGGDWEISWRNPEGDGNEKERREGELLGGVALDRKGSGRRRAEKCMVRERTERIREWMEI